ncbi:MAG: sugar phosphate isomerase/epimerase [Austwickia sp.]|nr:sugar phosphate isomerase/epimerase [Austwickia sp.]MCO5308078.1 sugar phosphate isomerase/epimerase [Austwickia sp.]
MTIGLSTYSFFWQWHEPTNPAPLGLTAMVAKTAELGCDLLQVCDYPPLERYDAAAVTDLRAACTRHGVRLELGTRGLDPDHLHRYLALAETLEATLVRSMIRAEEADRAEELLREALPAYEQADVSIALETYEQVPISRMMAVIEAIDSPHLGVALDPANCVAALQTPASTIAATAPRVLNLHVKDFAFTRQAGWVGFTYAGARLGEGLLDYPAMISAVQPEQRGINQIVEHWLVWQGDSATTCALEDDWTRHNLHYLRAFTPTERTDPR